MNSWITFLHIVLLPCIKEYKAEGTHNGTSRDEECPLGEKHILNISNKQSNIDSTASCIHGSNCKVTNEQNELIHTDLQYMQTPA